MELNFKQIRQIEYEILLDVDRVLGDLGLTYFLDFGTLLGARRHSGFIPWDDDIDIATAPKNIELFGLTASEMLPDHLTLIPHSVFPPALKVADRRYYMLERSLLNSTGTRVGHPGIDIFPFGYYRKIARFLPTKTVGRIAQKRPTAKTRARILFGAKSVNCVAFAAIASVPAPLLNGFENVVGLDSGKNWEHEHPEALVGHGLSMGTGIRYVPYSSVFPLREIAFEGKTFHAPNDTDGYLTELYGDWQQPVEYPQHLLRAWKP